MVMHFTDDYISGFHLGGPGISSSPPPPQSLKCSLRGLKNQNFPAGGEGGERAPRPPR